MTSRRLLRRSLVVATSAAVVALVAAMSTAGALPPPGDPGDPGGGHPRPEPTTTTRPPVTAPTPTPTPTPTVPREVRGFTVSTDSVVATATVQYNGTPPSLLVYWGDNTVTELTPPPANQVVLRHQYAVPPGGASFSQVINATVRGETDSRFVTIRPRYRITQHEASFANEDDCENWPDQESEWNISQYVIVSPGAPPVTNSWYQTRPMGTLNYFEPMAGSEITAEREAGARLQIVYEVYENDEPGTNDPAGQQAFSVTPDGDVGVDHLSLHFNEYGTCEARINADIEVRLIVP
jgi:hypothetical protein